MNTIPQIFDALGGAAKVARILGVGPSTASEMKRRQSIPLAYWDKLIAGAKREGVGLDYAILIHAVQRSYKSKRAAS